MAHAPAPPAFSVCVLAKPKLPKSAKATSVQSPLKLSPDLGAATIGSDVSPSVCTLIRSAAAGAMPHCEHGDSEASTADLCPALHIDNGASVADQGSIPRAPPVAAWSTRQALWAVSASQTKSSPLVCPRSLSFSTQPLCTAAAVCLGLGSAARWQPSALVPLYPAWQPASQPVHIPLRQISGPCSSIPAGKGVSQGTTCAEHFISGQV
ncbi:hypothetical protein J1605_014130 [Eschrichtius robustus]|uniref:Uncharacterized protein n=1 Tax=Eschrichtius robustus TaxID=9764 RepID=A0AB34GD85_ESCRO|nr:hypothetical protein J1605_014130 [Eschrichtius robustus]